MDKDRHQRSKIQHLLRFFPIIAIIGPRQSGKSTLVKSLPGPWKYYDLERPDDYQLISSDPLGFFERHPENVIIDEAQEFPELFKVLRGVVDKNRMAKGRFILTGSSSPKIVKSLSESLAGRIATIELMPFKGSEFYEKPLSSIYLHIADNNIENFIGASSYPDTEKFYRHWLYGGYPEARIESENNLDFFGHWMDQYFTSYVTRDIKRLFPRLNDNNFRRFLHTLAFHSGKILNQSTIARSLETSSVTIKEYLDIAHQTFIWRNIQSYEKNLLKKVQKLPKGHLRDSGLYHYLLKIQDVDSLLVHPDAGFSFESFMIEEIIRGFSATMLNNLDFYFYRTKDKSEIDLIIDSHFGPIPIEVKLGSKVTSKSLSALKNFIQETKAPFAILVNNAEKSEILDDRIYQIPGKYW